MFLLNIFIKNSSFLYNFLNLFATGGIFKAEVSRKRLQRIIIPFFFVKLFSRENRKKLKRRYVRRNETKIIYD